MEISTTDVVYREDLYPRFEASQPTIQKYAYSIEHLPPIKVNQNNILIDGYHRWKAHQLEGEEKISAEVIETDSEKELKKLAYKLNANHGLQLNNEEKRRYAQEMIGEMSVNDVASVLSVSASTVKSWTESQRKAAQEEQDRKIIEMYLRAWNTQQDIADVLGVPQQTIARKVDNLITQNDNSVNMGKEFKPLLYNIWNLNKQDNSTESHFGSFPLVFMKNLLYYHTKAMDVVFDPFAGGGTTVDACKDMARRFYCTDRVVKPGREKDIREHDIKDGLPDGLPKPKLAFLDPPYWSQAEGKYSDDSEDLGNMSLDDFNYSMQSLFSDLDKKKVEQIAVVIQPTQYKNKFQWIDHIFDFSEMLTNYKISMRYILPYSSQQYNAQMVEVAKSNKQCLCINRDLVVWSRKDD